MLDAWEVAIEKGIIKEEEITEEVLENFLGGFGRKFYGVVDGSGERIVLRKGGEKVRELVQGKGESGVQVVPFRRGKETWSVEWKKATS